MNGLNGYGYGETKYGGNIPPDILIAYFSKLIGRVFKALPFYESDETTLVDYIQYLLIEISAGNSLLVKDVGFFELMINLESLTNLSLEHKTYRSQVFKCINLCQTIIDDINANEECNQKDGETNGL